MKRMLIGSLVLVLVMSMASFAEEVVVYENDYEGQTPGTAFNEGGPWNWIDGDEANGFVKSHTAMYQSWDSMVVEHTGHIDNSAGTTDVDVRFGTKWTITMNGSNTSSNPADYTISFDVMSVMGNWDPIPLEFFVLTGEGNGVGLGSGASDYYQTGEWVHVEMGLDELTVGWWNGSDWDLTSATWMIELGGPGWPGFSVPAGTAAWDQVWLFDNLMITVPEPATMVLMGLGALAMLRKRK